MWSRAEGKQTGTLRSRRSRTVDLRPRPRPGRTSRTLACRARRTPPGVRAHDLVQRRSAPHRRRLLRDHAERRCSLEAPLSLPALRSGREAFGRLEGSTAARAPGICFVVTYGTHTTYSPRRHPECGSSSGPSAPGRRQGAISSADDSETTQYRRGVVATSAISLTTAAAMADRGDDHHKASNAPEVTGTRPGFCRAIPHPAACLAAAGRTAAPPPDLPERSNLGES